MKELLHILLCGTIYLKDLAKAVFIKWLQSSFLTAVSVPKLTAMMTVVTADVYIPIVKTNAFIFLNVVQLVESTCRFAYTNREFTMDFGIWYDADS